MAPIEKIALDEHFLDLAQDAYFRMLTGDPDIFASSATKPLQAKLTGVDERSGRRGHRRIFPKSYAKALRLAFRGRGLGRRSGRW